MSPDRPEGQADGPAEVTHGGEVGFDELHPLCYKGPNSTASTQLSQVPRGSSFLDRDALGEVWRPCARGLAVSVAMIRSTIQSGKLVCDAWVGGYGVYLDNDSLIDLAKGSASRQQGFVNALRRGGTLLFSWTNSIEVAGPQGASSAAVRDLLDSVGPHWVPLELNPWDSVDKEKAGLTSQAPVSDSFMKAYFQERAYELSPEGTNVLDLSAEVFFRLGAVVDWVQENRDSIERDKARIAHAFREQLAQLRADYENDQTSLDRQIPPIPFDERWPATFVCFHLQRLLVKEAKAYRFEDNDSLDFCHSVLAAAYGSLITLDRQWKRRVEMLPKPNRLTRVYYRPELDQLVGLLQSLVTSK